MKDSLIKKFITRIFIAVLLVSLLFSVVFLFILSNRFDRDYVSNIKSLNQLLSGKVVDYDIIMNKEIVGSLLNEEINTIVIVGKNGQVYYSTTHQHVGKDIWDIQDLIKYGDFSGELDGIKTKKVREGSNRFYISTSSITNEKNEHIGFLFTKTYREKLARKKAIFFLIFIAGISICILVIIFTFVRNFRKSVINRLKILLKLTREVEKGNIHHTIERIDSNDELGRLEKQFNDIVSSLSELSKFANEIEKGNFLYKFKPLSENDELGNSLIHLRDSLQKATEEEKERKKEDEIANWETNGIAKFAEILRRDNDNLRQLGYNVISNLVEYLNANQGGFFLLNDDNKNDKYLELQAAYAYNRRKFIEKRVDVGVGLLGNCILEGKTVYMTNIPNDYISITSGLGDSNPTCLLIVPLIANNEKFGCIEIASFGELKEYQIEFVNRLSESIASTISTVKINVQTTKLLKETNEQSERIKQAEEEMRQNMEEMQATQEESDRREKELRKELKNAEIKIKELERKIK